MLPRYDGEIGGTAWTAEVKAFSRRRKLVVGELARRWYEPIALDAGRPMERNGTTRATDRHTLDLYPGVWAGD